MVSWDVVGSFVCGLITASSLTERSDIVSCELRVVGSFVNRVVGIPSLEDAGISSFIVGQFSEVVGYNVVSFFACSMVDASSFVERFSDKGPIVEGEKEVVSSLGDVVASFVDNAIEVISIEVISGKSDFEGFFEDDLIEYVLNKCTIIVSLVIGLVYVLSGWFDVCSFLGRLVEMSLFEDRMTDVGKSDIVEPLVRGPEDVGSFLE